MISKILYFINILLINFLIINCQQVKIESKHLIKHDEKSFIVEIKKVKDEFKLSCICQKCLSLKFSFSNVIQGLSIKVRLMVENLNCAKYLIPLICKIILRLFLIIFNTMTL